MIEPLELQRFGVDDGVLAEVHLTYAALVPAVHPGPDDKALARSRPFRGRLPLHGAEAPDRRAQEHVVPTTNVERWHLHLGRTRLQIQRFPVVVVVGMGDPVAVVLNVEAERAIELRDGEALDPADPVDGETLICAAAHRTDAPAGARQE